MTHSMSWWKARIREDWENHGEIISRHTRHFAELKEGRSQEFWKELKEWAYDNYSIEMENVADRGVEYKEQMRLVSGEK